MNGDLAIEVERTLATLEYEYEGEREEFEQYLRETLAEHWRQKLLIWRCNRQASLI